MALRPLVEQLRTGLGVSVAEVEHQDTWQRCSLGVAMVSGDVATVEQLADQVERIVWARADTEVLSIERHWLEVDR